MPAVLALAGGGVLAVLLVIPYLWWSYRRRGELGAGHLVLAFGFLVYALALWTYTLLPVPILDPGREVPARHRGVHQQRRRRGLHRLPRQGRREGPPRHLAAAGWISEGLGLHAQDIIFPEDQAQAWLTDTVLASHRIPPDGSDFATIHHVQNVLWGAWGNAAFLAADHHPDTEIAEYLLRWALLTEAETQWTFDFLKTPGMNTYVLAYFHGWRLLQAWLNHPARTERVRRLLTEPLLPADLDTRTTGPATDHDKPPDKK